jgi:hypothetical protein
MPRLAMARKGSPGTGVRARLIAARGEASDDNPLWLPIIGGNDMQGEQCKANNASCLSILASGRRAAIFQTAFHHRDRAKHGVFRTIGMANVVAICFAAFQLGGKKCCLDALF